ncbi:MAG: hypothetical protein HYX48_04755 [Chlamydiales bacterium]|nr:hypothetical protein [Chlamydiales bacterium]
MNISGISPRNLPPPEGERPIRLPKEALEKAKEIEAHTHKIEQIIKYYSGERGQKEMAVAFEALGKDIEVLKKIVPPSIAPDVMSHLDTEFQFLNTHQDTFNREQLTEFSLITAKITDEIQKRIEF